MVVIAPRGSLLDTGGRTSKEALWADRSVSLPPSSGPEEKDGACRAGPRRAGTSDRARPSRASSTSVVLLRVDRLPTRLWTPGNLRVDGHLHFCVGRRANDGESVLISNCSQDALLGGVFCEQFAGSPA